MSCNREGVIWPTAGGYRYGLFAFEVYGDDPEWDVEYDFGRFDWCSPWCATAQAARDAWDGANPGGHTEATEPCPTYDAMAADYDDRESKRRALLRVQRRYRPTGMGTW